MDLIYLFASFNSLIEARNLPIDLHLLNSSSQYLIV